MIKSHHSVLFLSGLLLSLPLTCSYADTTEKYPKVGDKAPEFTAMATSRNRVKQIKLSDYRGKKVILYFYPKDNFPFCTKQAKSLKEQHKKLKNLGYVVLGVSKNSIKTHQKFIKKHALPFLLISDKKGELHRKYSTWSKKIILFGYTKRVTFIIDEEGNIQEVITRVKHATHADQIIAHHHTQNTSQ